MATGGCLCGAVRFEFEGVPLLSIVCHCRSCRRANGAPAVAWLTVRRTAFRLTAGRTQAFESSPGVTRAFCAACGTPLTWCSTTYPSVIDVTTVSLDQPEAFPPTREVWLAHRLDWSPHDLRIDGYRQGSTEEPCGPAERFWHAYLNQLPSGHPHHRAQPDAFAFAGGGALGDQLAALVLAGTKRATTSLPAEYEVLGEPLPQAGSLSIILDGDQRPVAIIERTRVQTLPFAQVDSAFAAIEGEGDGSLAYWRRAHLEYFGSVCERLGGRFDEQTPVICQVFRMVWPAPVAGDAPAGTAEG